MSLQFLYTSRCIQCSGIPWRPGFGYTHLVSECGASTVICWRSLLCGIWQRYRLLISQEPWPRATSSTLLWGAFDFWRKGRDTPSLTQSLPCIPQWVFSPLITHSFPPCTRSYPYSPVSQVTGLHSLAYIQHYILYIAFSESTQWFITKSLRCHQADFCCVMGSVQPISRIFQSRVNLFPPLVQDSTRVCQLLK